MMLSDVCLSVAYIGPKSRTERPRRTKLGTEVDHVTRDSDTIFRVKGQGHQAALIGCSSHYIIYMDDTIHILRYLQELAAACRPWGLSELLRAVSCTTVIFTLTRGQFLLVN